MINTAIILAGGFGTRLQSVVTDLPKPMAPVNDVPFLNYQLNYLKHFGIKEVIISTGHLAEKISSYYKSQFNGLKISYSHEENALGTGGGIRLALEKSAEEKVFVLNGDSFFDADLHEFFRLHNEKSAQVSLALRRTDNASRYGTIEINKNNRIISFKEKQNVAKPGLINAGIYIIEKNIYLKNTPPESNFSIEKDFFEKQLNSISIYGFEFKGYFIDIGIPEDYVKSQSDFKEFKYMARESGSNDKRGRGEDSCAITESIQPDLGILSINKSWTLFLDRDGVINKKLDNDYVKHWMEFEFMEGVLDALKMLNSLFGKIVVVTNQQGIGKRIYRTEDLELIHKNMIYELNYAGGRIDKVYFSPYLDSENHPTRKPGTGMALKAKEDYPEIDFEKSIIVGDSMSDMEFGRALGMKTVFISESEVKDKRVDFSFKSLLEFTKSIEE